MTSSRETLVRLDEILLYRFDAEVTRGETAAGHHVTCHLGCTECCIGPFEISALDALRLRSGFASLPQETAQEIRERARAQWDLFRPSFPGDTSTGVLDDDERERESFCETFASVLCPVLDPGSGACLLYEHRLLACRSFGLPVVQGDERLPPCRLNFTSADDSDVMRATIEPDPEYLEGDLLVLLDEEGETVIAAAVAISAG
ncbi:MAG TPA: YkgJ family cysteine cluster protein [Vicinamibacteria bacterium]|nr:YkgJ family cysteine cluster protein [Vicinamibacteria bacterium]